MKKQISILLSILMLLSVAVFAGCDKKEATLKLGLGVYVDVDQASSAEGDANGQGHTAITAAAVTVDADGKVVACQLDTADITVTYTAEGKAIANNGFKTKYEMGDDYNMVAYGNATQEWYRQADAFETLVVGKTLDEIKALLAAENKGTDEVISAGCTIQVHEFVKAIEKAFANLTDSSATASSALKLGIHTEQTTKDAVEDAEGYSQVETTIFAATVDGEGKVQSAASDCAQIKFTFDAAGGSTFDLTKAVSTKREQGSNYGMVAYGNAAKEWFEQADAFNTLCVGKTATEIAALCGADNYGTDEVKSAGCTVLVNGLTKAAAKIG